MARERDTTVAYFTSHMLFLKQFDHKVCTDKSLPRQEEDLTGHFFGMGGEMKI